MIDYFRFEVAPYLYAGQHGGTERVLKMTVFVNGRELARSQVIDGNVPDWQSVLRHLADRAVDMLEHQLKEGSSGN